MAGGHTVRSSTFEDEFWRLVSCSLKKSVNFGIPQQSVDKNSALVNKVLRTIKPNISDERDKALPKSSTHSPSLKSVRLHSCDSLKARLPTKIRVRSEHLPVPPSSWGPDHIHGWSKRDIGAFASELSPLCSATINLPFSVLGWK